MAKASKYCEKKGQSLPKGEQEDEIITLRSQIISDPSSGGLWISARDRNDKPPSLLRKVNIAVRSTLSSSCLYMKSDGTLGADSCWAWKTYICGINRNGCPADRGMFIDAVNWFTAWSKCRKKKQFLFHQQSVQHCSTPTVKFSEFWIDGQLFQWKYPSGEPIPVENMLWDPTVPETALGYCAVINRRGYWEPRGCNFSTAFICVSTGKELTSENTTQDPKRADGKYTTKITYTYVFIASFGMIVILFTVCMVIILLKRCGSMQLGRKVTQVDQRTPGRENTVLDSDEYLLQRNPQNFTARSSHNDGYLEQACCPGPSKVPVVEGLPTETPSSEQDSIASQEAICDEIPTEDGDSSPTEIMC